MQVHGLLVARNEADIIRTNVLYHLSLGLDRLLVVDNGSSDGTDRVLRELGKDPRVRWTRDEGLFYHGQIATDWPAKPIGRGPTGSYRSTPMSFGMPRAATLGAFWRSRRPGRLERGS